MKVREIKAMLEIIKANAYDDEVAHSYEDDLYVKVLRAIAEGAPNAQKLAKTALKARDINFARWTA